MFTKLLNFKADGGFEEYCISSAEKLFQFENLLWEEAAVFKATSCMMHGMEPTRPRAGSTMLLMGSGPTGLCFSQLLRNNSGPRVVLALNKRPKLDLTKRLHAADQYVELDRTAPDQQ